MKQLLIYTNPDKKFDKEKSKSLINIQIDNNYDLGWKKKDIFLFTNFPYEYNGIKALIVPDIYCKYDYTGNKMPVISHLFKQGFFKNELYWYHDLDAYENYKINEEDLGLGRLDMGLTNYTYKPTWNGGCFFFRKGAKDIFELINKKIIELKKVHRVDEMALKILTRDNLISRDRYKLLNGTYNFPMRHIYISYKRVERPIKVLHFDPVEANYKLKGTLLDVFMYGKNAIGFPLMSERLIKIFNQHGFK